MHQAFFGAASYTGLYAGLYSGSVGVPTDNLVI